VAARQGAVCPTCWAPLRRGARVCPSCRAEVTLTVASAVAETSAPGPGAAPATQGRPQRRVGPWLAAAVAATALLTAGTIKVVSGLLPPPGESGAPTGNVGPRLPVMAATAVRALYAFQPAGDVESVGVAIAYATRDRGALPSALVRTSVRPGPQGSQLVTVAVPVDVAFLLKVRAIQTGFSPNLSNLHAGRLYVNAADDNAYGIVMNPRTHVAVFAFRLSADDGSIWARNLNALQVISQTQSLG
jgi:hypothetical protein